MCWPLNDTPSPLDKGERQMYEWMCKLVHEMDKTQILSRDHYQTARDIASFLPKPADPDKQAVRDILSGSGGFIIPASDDSMMWSDVGCAANVALTCIKRGREMQKEGK